MAEVVFSGRGEVPFRCSSGSSGSNNGLGLVSWDSIAGVFMVGMPSFHCDELLFVNDMECGIEFIRENCSRPPFKIDITSNPGSAPQK